MGCSGRVLQKRLWNKLDNVFLFDFGSLLDALCGWDTRAWIKLSKFDAKKFISLLEQKPKILYTAALIDNKFEERKLEYIKSAIILRDLGYEPYIVESCYAHGPSFLDECSQNVFYAGTNNPNLKNKGINEFRSMAKAFDYFNFDDNDMIIKLTGRYYFNHPGFLQEIENHPSVDIWVKKYEQGQTSTGCFAMRARLLKQLLQKMPFDEMEKRMINVEKIVADYVESLKNTNVSIRFVETLGLTSNIFGTGNPQLIYQ
jgi:hypothetical protein